MRWGSEQSQYRQVLGREHSSSHSSVGSPPQQQQQQQQALLEDADVGDALMGVRRRAVYEEASDGSGVCLGAGMGGRITAVAAVQ